MKNLYCLILVLVVVFLLVPVVFASQKTTITFQQMSTIPQALDVTHEAFRKFEEMFPDVKIEEILVGWGEAHAQFMNSLVVGMAPDLVMLGGPWAPEFIGMGAFAPVDQYVSAEILDIFIPAAFAAIKAKDGHIYGVPWEGSTWAFFYRKDLFEEVGLNPNSPPENWSDLVDYAQKLTKDDQYGLALAAAGWEPADYFLPFVWQAGVEPVVEENGKWRGNFSSPEATEATQFYADLIHKHKVVSKAITSMDWESVKNSFVSSRAAMMYNGMWVVNIIRDGNPELDGKWATAVNPAGLTGVRAALGYPNHLHITTQSKNKELAGKFIDLYYGGESPTYADKYAILAGSLNWTKPFMDLPYAKDELLAPFAESMQYSHFPPLAPKYEDFRALYFNPGIQSLILGQISVEDFVKEMDDKFNSLHQGT